MSEALFIVLLIFLLAAVFALVNFARKKESELKKEKEESQRRLYEVSILKEIGERAGYSLDVEQILQIISGSLHQFIDYSVVSYIVILPNKLKLSTHLEQSVDHGFLKNLKDRMIASLSALGDKKFDDIAVEELVSGAIIVDTIPQQVGSFFNIPLVIGGNLAGLLTVAHMEKGLYKEADMTILYKITNQASQAVSRLEEVVKIEQGKLNAMVESMGDGVLMVDEDYRIIVSNPAVRKMISFSPPVGETKDITIFDFIDALGGKFDIRGRLEEAIVRGSEHHSPRKLIGQTFFEVGVFPVRHIIFGSEKTFGAVVVFHDITQEVELEKVREEFTSMIVHELRSPLDGMRKIVELIVGGKIKKTSKEFAEYIKLVYQSSTSMLELVNDILDFSKLQAGKFEIHKEEASIKEIVENRIDFYKVSADNKKIKLTSVIDDDIPNMVSLDQRSVRQVINNLVSNSLKFTPEGGEIKILAFILQSDGNASKKMTDELNSLSAKIGLTDIKQPKSSLVVVVSDIGMGIPKDKMNDLFLKYKQVGSSPMYSEEKGTGLGLVIAKGIVESHGGIIGVVSVQNEGSSFYFTLPME